ncbi:unnamed protein product (macronuclear) [Paramecium tetraurelia]|uniref:Chromosome undetermined scaffold_1, whole genome shotgun sequence n=1 Tax=Paramecium tetraurelia TaxID=5888 RepID=Q6BFX8_PARTE|nr:hypothetical protein [Paramecium tetraurelia strain d4-2]XP_001423234.1 uncharacterized protein GSPATT00000271001 [Paramecium tetraurelia]CAH03442.1 hypothetical protein with coiled-coil domains [Paramecium tetraurelia]CAK55836.1 unnamed protein product [Paramecium tetraurelia]|eukprot:XP_001423234.1 hypothetical protein (macronuclear) [Paramecium tetraurelia strain d4-2]
MKVIITLNSEQHEIELQDPTIEALILVIQDQFNIAFNFELLTTDNQTLTELQEGMQIIVEKVKNDKANLQKFKSFFSIAGSIIKSKTISHGFSISTFNQVQRQKSLDQKSEQRIQTPEQQAQQINTNIQSINEQNIQKCELSGILQQDSAMILDEKQSDRLLLNELQEQAEQNQKLHNSQEQKKRPKNHSIKQQSQTTKEQAFAYAEELASIPRPNKRQLILQRMEEDKAEKERIAKQQQEANRIIKQIQEKMKQKELLLKQKEEALQVTELEKRKAVLAQKRELSQPIKLSELTEHQKKYEEERKIKEFEREHHKQEIETEIKQKSFKFPKSQAQIRVEEEQKMQKLIREQEMEQKKLARLKQLKYADVAQEIYFKEHPVKPKQSPPPKEDQSKQIKEIQVTEQNLRKIKKFVPQQRHFSHDSKDSITDLSNHQENRPPKPQIKKQQKVLEKAEKPSELPPKPKTTDYLQQLRQQRKVQVNMEDQWEKIIENKGLENEQKVQNVLNNVQRLEQKAKEREKLALINRDLEAEEEANNLYIASIRAKLAILEKN